MASAARAAARLLPLLALLALHLTPACDAAEAHQEQPLDPTVYHWPAFSSSRKLQAAEPAAGMAQAAAEAAFSTGRRLQAAEPAAAEAAEAKAPKAKVVAAFRHADKLKGKAVAVPTAGVPQVAALPASTVELKAEDTTWQAELDSLFDDPTAAAAAQEAMRAEGTPAAATEPKAAAPAAPAKQEPAAEEQQEQPATPVASEEAEQPAADAKAELPQPAADSATPGTDAFKQAVSEAVSKVIQEMMAKGTLGQVGQQQQEQVPKSTAPAPFAGRFANTQQPGVDVPAAAAAPQAPRKHVSSGDAGSPSEDEQQQQQAGDKPAAATVDRPDKQPQAVSTPAVHSEPRAPATQPPVVQADPPKPAVIVTPAQPAAPKAPSKAKKATKGTAGQLLGGMFGGIFGETKLPEQDADIPARDVNVAAPAVGLGLFAGGGDMTEALQLLMLSEKQRKANLAQKTQQALLPPHIAAAPAKASAARRKKADANELLNNMFGF